MKNFGIRLGIVAGVLAIIVAGASTLADPPTLEDRDTSNCGKLRHYACDSACGETPYTHGLCRDKRDGSTSAITVQCCCCTEGANHRSFIGG